ncbi:putative MFS general substrate transporter [Lyophyllum shimeji]|uniref:MFS general substrate transporter n=1 Tax=Lyophyllum shimeji TaxID=47721 RepID=A0A9P3UNV8_LYOSH|nr:putative MFS general substrate transporter [Lyophyllum shimeji]
MSADALSSTLHDMPFEQQETSQDDKGHQETTQLMPKDGGSQAWMTVAATWLVQFCTYGYISAFGVYQDYYTRDFLRTRSPSDISWIGSFQLFMMYAPGVLVGRAFDAGYFHYMAAAGSALQVITMFLLSLARPEQYWQVFLAQALGTGLGQSMIFLPSITIIGHHFKRRRAMATGIAVSGASLGGIIWPVLLSQLDEKMTFANSIRASAAVTALLLFTANILFKTQPHTKCPSSKLPAPILRVILQDTAYLTSVGAGFCISLGLFFPYFYLQLYAIDKGISEGVAFYALAIINAGSFCGRILPNVFADRTGPYNMLVPCLFISSGLVFSILGITSFAGVAIFGMLYGFWSGSYVSLIPSLLAQLSTHAGEQGTRMGVAFSVVSVALLVGTPIAGALVDEGHGSYSWYKAITFCGGMTFCGTIGMLISRQLFLRQHRGDEQGWRV